MNGFQPVFVYTLVILSWESSAITNIGSQREYRGNVRDFRHISEPSSTSLTDWEIGLRESVNQALLREGYQDPNLRERLLKAPLIGRRDTATPFGDVAILARGQLYGTQESNFAFVQDQYQNDCDDCHNTRRCSRHQCQVWKPHQHERLLALWTVKRLRHRGFNDIHRYELEYTISAMSSAINHAFITKNGRFDYAIPGHVFVIKSRQVNNNPPTEPYTVYNRKIPQGHFKPNVLIGVDTEGRKHILHSYPGFFTSFPVNPTYHEDHSTNNPKEIDLYKKLIESLASKTSTTLQTDKGAPYRFSFNQFIHTMPSYALELPEQTPLVQSPTEQIPLTPIYASKPGILSITPTTQPTTENIFPLTDIAYPSADITSDDIKDVSHPSTTTSPYFMSVSEKTMRTTKEMMKITKIIKPTFIPKSTKKYYKTTIRDEKGIDFLFPNDHTTATSITASQYFKSTKKPIPSTVIPERSESTSNHLFAPPESSTNKSIKSTISKKITKSNTMEATLSTVESTLPISSTSKGKLTTQTKFSTTSLNSSKPTSLAYIISETTSKVTTPVTSNSRSTISSSSPINRKIAKTSIMNLTSAITLVTPIPLASKSILAPSSIMNLTTATTLVTLIPLTLAPSNTTNISRPTTYITKSTRLMTNTIVPPFSTSNKLFTQISIANKSTMPLSSIFEKDMIMKLTKPMPASTIKSRPTPTEFVPKTSTTPKSILVVSIKAINTPLNISEFTTPEPKKLESSTKLSTITTTIITKSTRQILTKTTRRTTPTNTGTIGTNVRKNTTTIAKAMKTLVSVPLLTTLSSKTEAKASTVMHTTPTSTRSKISDARRLSPRPSHTTAQPTEETKISDILQEVTPTQSTKESTPTYHQQPEPANQLPPPTTSPDATLLYPITPITQIATTVYDDNTPEGALPIAGSTVAMITTFGEISNSEVIITDHTQTTTLLAESMNTSEDINKATESNTIDALNEMQPAYISTPSSIVKEITPGTKQSVIIPVQNVTNLKRITHKLAETTHKSGNEYTIFQSTTPTLTSRSISTTTSNFLLGTEEGTNIKHVKKDYDEDDIFGTTKPTMKPTKMTRRKIMDSALAQELFNMRDSSNSNIIYSNFYEASTASMPMLTYTAPYETTIDDQPLTSQSYETSISFEVNKRNNRSDSEEYLIAQEAALDKNLKDKNKYTSYKTEHTSTTKKLPTNRISLNQKAATDYLSRNKTSRVKYKRKPYTPKNRKTNKRKP